MKANSKENGTELQRLCLNSAEVNTQSSDPQVHHLEECSKAKVVENYQHSSGLMRDDWIFFAHLFLSISSVLTEQSHICVTNVNLALLEQGDLSWQYNLTHCLSQQVWWKHRHLRPMTFRKKIYCKSTKSQWRGVYNKNVMTFCIDAGFLTTVGVGQYFMTRQMKNSHNLFRVSDMSWVHFAKRWQIIWPERLDSRDTKIGPVLEITTSNLQGKFGVEIRMVFVYRFNSLVGHKFSWLE